MSCCCPRCASESSIVLRTRQTFNMIRRERICKQCNQHYFTAEFAFAEIVFNKETMKSTLKELFLETFEEVYNEVENLKN